MAEVIDLDSDVECIDNDVLVIDDPELCCINGSTQSSIDDPQPSTSGLSRFSGTTSAVNVVYNITRDFYESSAISLDDFNKKCLTIVGTKSSRQLDALMDKYLTLMRREYEFCSRSPARSFHTAKKMLKHLMFFYMYYQDVKDLFITSHWMDNMTELLAIYCKLEINSAMRLQRGTENDNLIAGRIMNLLWITLENKEIHILHVLLKMVRDNCFKRRQRDIFGPIFRKLLTIKCPRECTDLEYLRLIFSYKTWKRLLYMNEKKEISDMCFRLIKPPPRFRRTYKQYRILPTISENTGMHQYIVTFAFDLPVIVQKYFLCIEDKKNNTPIESAEQIDKQISFSTDFCMNYFTEEDLTEDFSESCLPLLNSIKEETDKIGSVKSNTLNTVPKDKMLTPVELIDLTDEEITEPEWVSYIADIAEKYRQEMIEQELSKASITDSKFDSEKLQKTCEQPDSTGVTLEEVSDNSLPCSSNIEDVSPSLANDSCKSPSTSFVSKVDNDNIIKQITRKFSDVTNESSISNECIQNEPTTTEIPAETVINKCHIDEIPEPKKSVEIVTENTAVAKILTELNKTKDTPNSFVSDISTEIGKTNINNDDLQKENNKVTKKVEEESNNNSKCDKLDEEFIESLFNSDIAMCKTKAKEKEIIKEPSKSITPKSVIDSSAYFESILNKIKNSDVASNNVTTHSRNLGHENEELKKIEDDHIKHTLENDYSKEIKQCKVQIDKLKILPTETKVILEKDITLTNRNENKSPVSSMNNINETNILEQSKINTKKHKRNIDTSKPMKVNGTYDTRETKKNNKEECILKVYKKNATIEHQDKIQSFQEVDNVKFNNRHKKDNLNYNEDRETRSTRRTEENEVENTNSVSDVKESHKRGRRKKIHKHKSSDYNNETISLHTRSRDRIKAFDNVIDEGNTTNNDTPKTKEKKHTEIYESKETIDESEAIKKYIPADLENTYKSGRRKRRKTSDSSLLVSELKESEKTSKKELIKENIIQDSLINSNIVENIRQTDSYDFYESYAHITTSRENVCITPIHIIDDNTLLGSEMIIQGENIQTEVTNSNISDFHSVSMYADTTDDLENIHVTVMEESLDYCENVATIEQNLAVASDTTAIVSNVDFEQFAEQNITHINSNKIKNACTNSIPVSKELMIERTPSSICSNDHNDIFNFANFAKRNSDLSDAQTVNIKNNMSYRDKRKCGYSDLQTFKSTKIPKMNEEYSVENMEKSKSLESTIHMTRTTIGRYEKYLMKNIGFSTADLRKMDVRVSLTRSSSDEIGRFQQHEPVREVKQKPSTFISLVDEVKRRDVPNKAMPIMNSQPKPLITDLFDEQMMKLLRSQSIGSTILERRDYLRNQNEELLQIEEKKKKNRKKGKARVKFALDVQTASPTGERGIAYCPDMDTLFTNLDSLNLNSDLINTPINISEQNISSNSYCDYILQEPSLMPPTILSPTCLNLTSVNDLPLPASLGKDPYWEGINENMLISNKPNIPHLLVESTKNTDLPTDVKDEDKFDSNIELMLKVNGIESPCASPDHETHLPIKKRRISALNIVKEETRDIRDEISYPPTPMMSIAALENMKPQYQTPIINLRNIDDLKPPIIKFKTPAQLKEIPPLTYNTVPLEQPLSINHTYNNPTINYHIGGVWGAASGPVAPPLACPGPWAPTTCYYAPPPPSYKKKQNKSYKFFQPFF